MSYIKRKNPICLETFPLKRKVLEGILQEVPLDVLANINE
jgi:hypothetical protein